MVLVFVFVFVRGVELKVEIEGRRACFGIGGHRPTLPAPLVPESVLLSQAPAARGDCLRQPLEGLGGVRTGLLGDLGGEVLVVQHDQVHVVAEVVGELYPVPEAPGGLAPELLLPGALDDGVLVLLLRAAPRLPRVLDVRPVPLGPAAALELEEALRGLAGLVALLLPDAGGGQGGGDRGGRGGRARDGEGVAEHRH